jgi:hypothetical protein
VTPFSAFHLSIASRNDYARAKIHTIEIKGASHSVYESHPREVAAVIAEAARNAQK